MNTIFIFISSIAFIYSSKNLLFTELFPLEETGMQNFLIAYIIVAILSLILFIVFARREYKGAKKNKMNLFAFFKQVLFKNTSFTKKYASEKRPAFLFLTIFLSGSSGILASLNGAHYLYYGGVSTWFSVWALILIFGLAYGYIRYYLAGFLYQIGLYFSGKGFRDLVFSRNIVHYTFLPLFVMNIVIKIIEMFVYGDDYFISPTYRWLNLIKVLLILSLGIYSIISLYKASRSLKNVTKWMGIVFFGFMPTLLFILILRASIAEAFYSLTVPIDYNNQGIEYINEGKLDKAEESFQNTIQSIDSKNNKEKVTAYINLATTYQNKGDIESAKDNYKEALVYLTKEDAQYYGIHGIISLFDSNLDEAIEFFDKAIQIDAQNYTANNYLGLIYLGNFNPQYANPKKALNYNIIIYKKDTNDSIATQNLALNLFQLQQFTESLPLFEDLYTSMPNNALVQYYLGLNYYYLKDFEQATPLLKSAVELEPNLLSDDLKAIFDKKVE